MAAVVGFAFLLTAVTPVGKRVFLHVITTIPNAMRRMATTAGFFYRRKPDFFLPPTADFLYLLMRVYPENIEAHETHMTPTAKRNSYRVAIIVVSATQGSVLRPQPWAGESQLRQSCRCLGTCCYVVC